MYKQIHYSDPWRSETEDDPWPGLSRDATVYFVHPNYPPLSRINLLYVRIYCTYLNLTLCSIDKFF